MKKKACITSLCTTYTILKRRISKIIYCKIKRKPFCTWNTLQPCSSQWLISISTSIHLSLCFDYIYLEQKTTIWKKDTMLSKSSLPNIVQCMVKNAGKKQQQQEKKKFARVCQFSTIRFLNKTRNKAPFTTKSAKYSYFTYGAVFPTLSKMNILPLIHS